MKIFSFIFILFISLKLFSQDSLTVEQAIKYAVDHNYGVIISRNEIEIGRLNNNKANAGYYPTVSATANKAIGISNIQQKLNSGVITNKNGTSTRNLNAGVNVNWRVFDGYKMFAVKHRLEELEKLGEYNFRKTINETVYDVIAAYYNIVRLNQQLKATLEQIRLYEERYRLADMRFNIGSGAKYEVLQSQIDMNEQRSSQINIENQIAIAKNNLNNLLGKNADTSYKVADTIMLKPLPGIADVNAKVESQNHDLLIANSTLAILLHTKREINAAKYPVITLNGNYNFVRSSNSAGFYLFNQNYGPSGAVGIAVPLFNGGIIKKQLQVADINIKDQNLGIEQLKNKLEIAISNAFINYQNAVKLTAFERTNLTLASENIFIALQRYRLLNITSVELRQVQISYMDAENRLYNALYQAKLAEAEISLLTGEITNL